MAAAISTLAVQPFHAREAVAQGSLRGKHAGREHRGGRVASPVAGSLGDAAAAGGRPQTLRRLVDAGQPVYCGAGTKPIVALTFDDGPGPYTQETIDLLKANGMTATFFTVGKLYSDPRFHGLLREEARFGAVGDHTWDHVTVTGMSRTQLAAQIARTRRAAAADSGQPVFLFRPPLGLHDRTVDTYVRSLGMLDILWSVDSGDSQGANADRIFRTVRDHLSPGDIVLLHENRGTTQNALPRIIRLIRARGYRTVTVPQMLRMDPPSARQLRQHACP